MGKLVNRVGDTFNVFIPIYSSLFLFIYIRTKIAKIKKISGGKQNFFNIQIVILKEKEIREREKIKCYTTNYCE